MGAIAKLVFLILDVVALRYGATSPNVPPPTEQLREQRGVEHVVPFITGLFKTLVYAWALLEFLTLILAFAPLHLSRTLPVLTPTPGTPTLTPAFIAGTLLVVASAALRVYCYRALGLRFTFELTIRPAHALVTHGAYGVVRHPAYTGAFGIGVAWFLLVLDRQGAVVSVLVRACGSVWPDVCGNVPGNGQGVVTAALACAWATGLSFIAASVVERMNKEDAMLEAHFGEAWRAWAKQVPWRLVPGVY